MLFSSSALIPFNEPCSSNICACARMCSWCLRHALVSPPQQALPPRPISTSAVLENERFRQTRKSCYRKLFTNSSGTRSPKKGQSTTPPNVSNDKRRVCIRLLQIWYAVLSARRRPLSPPFSKGNRPPSSVVSYAATTRAELLSGAEQILISEARKLRTNKKLRN